MQPPEHANPTDRLNYIIAIGLIAILHLVVFSILILTLRGKSVQNEFFMLASGIIGGLVSYIVPNAGRPRPAVSSEPTTTPLALNNEGDVNEPVRSDQIAPETDDAPKAT